MARRTPSFRSLRFLALALVGQLVLVQGVEAEISYTKDVLPILRENCQGCHQPAASRGGYLMTNPTALLAGGESGEAAVVPHATDSGSLLRMITPENGQAEMPKGAAPLSSSSIEVIRQWIAEGAVIDLPPKRLFDAEHPPEYASPPVVTSMDFSPDGKFLAVGGFSEVLLFDPSSNKLLHRLIGVSPRIESVRFSHDGQSLAVAAGEPSVSGELQVWNVADGKLLLSKSLTGDTLSGVSWSPDDRLIGFACNDNTVRCIDAKSGQQVLYQGAHDDWPHATQFSVSGEHLISAGRDMTVKLTEVATQRFIDNVTSITPGALRGGINAIARHPQRDEIIVGSSDGVPKIYRVFRQTARQIGDDANLIRRLPEMPGRIFDVRISSDAKYMAALSTLDGKSFIRAWVYETPENLPEDIKAIQSKRTFDRSPEERAKLEAFVTTEPVDAGKWEIDTAAYALAISPDYTLSTVGANGLLHGWRLTSGEQIAQTSIIPNDSLVNDKLEDQLQENRVAYLNAVQQATESTPAPSATTDDVYTSVVVEPQKIALSRWNDYVQILVTGVKADGSTTDLTASARQTADCSALVYQPGGYVEAKATGAGQLELKVGGQSIAIPYEVTDVEVSTVDFVRDVNPVLSKLGCNQGTCHGAQAGKNGFKLSLRGYDPLFDVRSLTDDLAARRVNFSSPVDSLMISKPLGYVPHAGGVLMKRGDLHSTILEKWIAQTANLERASTKAMKIELSPTNPVVPAAGSLQQVRVIATFQDGSQRDVTREAFVESSNLEVATVDRHGLASALRRGEAPLLARYEGCYAATTLTVMGNREGYHWEQPEVWSAIDAHVADKWQRMKIAPSNLCSDEEFIRRVYLDLTGLPPTADQVVAFVSDTTALREKRDALIDKLVGSPNFVAHWTNKWADLLQVNSKFLGKEGATAFRQWIAERVERNMPYDQFAKEILTASGSNRENPAASYYKILRTPEDTMENTTHLFLAVRFNCNKCHDHPFERWTQDQYYETAAFFAQFDLKRDEASGDRNIGGTAVEGAKPLYEEVFDKQDGEIKHQRTNQTVAPEFPYDCDFNVAENASRRERMAAWMTSPDNPYFARSYVNRLWGYMFGVGLIEPLDDIRAGNPPTIPAVLDELEKEFISSGFNVQQVIKTICKSRVYQLDSGTNSWNEDDGINYSHAIARRLPAEVLYDAVHFVTGTETAIPGVNKGTRAASLPDADAGLPDGFLNNLGRPARESACECERSNDLQLGAVMALLSGPTIGNAISQTNNALHQLVAEIPDNRQLIERLYLRVLNRPASDAEIKACEPLFQQIVIDHEALQLQLAQAEESWVKERVEREEKRLVALEAARGRLAARQSEIADERNRLEAERKGREDAARAALATYLQNQTAGLDAWLNARRDAARWDLVMPLAASSTNQAKLVAQADRSIIVEGSKDKGTYHIDIRPNLTEINALRLETLLLPGIPGGGPGLPGNGNFVVTEFEVFVGPATDPAAMQQLKIKDVRTDFDQASFSGAAAIDGKQNDQGGWAIANAGGAEHWIVFALEKPVVLPDGWVIQVRIHQFHDAPEHRLGHFRLSAARVDWDLKAGLSESFVAIANTPQTQRTEGQVQTFQSYFTKTDAEYQRLQTVVAQESTPLPPDEQIVAINVAIGRLEKETPDDVSLVQLRLDLEQSRQQLDNLRVTAAEDITWALINSPAFLFNH